MRKSQQEWSFYVDESGDFTNLQAAVSVAGLLICEAEGFYRPDEIRKSLEGAVPGFPWPLHASFVNQPSYVAIAAYQHDPGVLDRQRAGFGATVRTAIAACEAYGLVNLDSVTAAIKGGRKPPYDALRRLSDIVRQHAPDSHAHLVDASREAWRAVRIVAERLSAARDRDGREVAAFVAASESSVGDAANDSETARYFSVLQVAAQRAAALIERTPGRHTLSLRVQQRHVYDERFKKRVMLTPQHLGPISRQVERMHPRVHVVAAETPSFDASVAVEYVLADFLANRSRGVLDDVESELFVVEERLGDYFGCPLRSGTRYAVTSLPLDQRGPN